MNTPAKLQIKAVKTPNILINNSKKEVAFVRISRNFGEIYMDTCRFRPKCLLISKDCCIFAISCCKIVTMKREAKIMERMLHFKQPAGTSRGVYTERKIWLVELCDGEHVGVGECAPLPDLSCDAGTNYEATLRHFCDEWERCDGSDDAMERLYEQMRDFPSMLFGLETAMLELRAEKSGVSGSTFFDTPFCRGEEGIPINGLVWMGSYDEMLEAGEGLPLCEAENRRH